MMRSVVKHFIFFIPLCLLLFGIWQQHYQYFYIKPLSGSFTKKEKPIFDWSAWFSGSYQHDVEGYKNENFGFRNILVRLNHQIDFLCFKKANAAWVIVGKQNFIYELGYIDAYYGRDFIGYDKINKYLKKLKQVQDTLQKRGKLFILIFAPGKASFYPEYIPDELKTEIKPSNYLVLSSKAKTLGVNYIDFNNYFIEQKNKSQYPLYPQFGIHWSNYGAVKSFDSISSYIEQKLQVNLPDLKITSVEMPDTLRESDNDLIKGMNVFWQPKTFKMAYPVFTVHYDSLKHKKLNSIVVSDSFWWQIYGAGLQKNTFKEYNFWYYNKEIHPDFWKSPLYVNRSNYFARLKNADVIIILQTEATLKEFGFGFVDLCYETFCQKPNKMEEELQRIKETMVKNKEWFASVEQKAKERNLNLDTMINQDAVWFYNNKIK